MGVALHGADVGTAQGKAARAAEQAVRPYSRVHAAVVHNGHADVGRIGLACPALPCPVQVRGGQAAACQGGERGVCLPHGALRQARHPGGWGRLGGTAGWLAG